MYSVVVHGYRRSRKRSHFIRRRRTHARLLTMNRSIATAVVVTGPREAAVCAHFCTYPLPGEHYIITRRFIHDSTPP